MSYSYSKLSTYLQCPFKYKKHYIEKIRQQKSNMIWGIIAHNLLAKKFGLDEPLEYTLSENDMTQINECVDRTYKYLQSKIDQILGVEIELKDDTFGLIGYADLVYLQKDKVIILDFKSSNFIPKYKNLEESLQHQMYFYMLPEAQKFMYYYIKKTKNQTRVMYNSDFKFKFYLDRLINHIEKETEFLPTKNKFCKWCEFSKECASILRENKQKVEMF